MSSNHKLEVALASQKHQSTGHQKVVKEASSQDKLWLMSSNFYHKVLFYKWEHSVQTREWHSYGHRPGSILGKPLPIFLWI